MSAIKEWFGIYNMLFRHMKETFGENELNEYLEYLGDTAYADVSADFAENGIERISERYMDNFIKDGGKAAATVDRNVLDIYIEACPAFEYMLASSNPYDKPEQYYCDCCRKLNYRILANAGYGLEVSDISNSGSCRWKVVKGADEEQ